MVYGGVKVEGLGQLVRALEEMGLEVTDLKDAFSKISRQGADVASSFAPHRSGRLSGSIRGNRAKSKAVIMAGKKAVPYAGPINYGWPAHNIEPSSFMQKTDEVMKPVALDELDEELIRIIRQKGL